MVHFAFEEIIRDSLYRVTFGISLMWNPTANNTDQATNHMAQQCAIQNQHKVQQLKKAAEDFTDDKNWQRYLDLCELDGVTPKNLLTDTSYYEHVERIEGCDIYEALEGAINELYERAIQEDPQKRTERRLRRNKSCNNCKGKNVMYIGGYTRDTNDITFPSGIELESCYCPKIPHLGFYKSLGINLCLDCGCLVGFNKQVFYEATMMAEYFGDMNV